RLGEPVADLRRHPLDIAVQHEADAADRLVGDGDCKRGLRRPRPDRADELARVVNGGGMRKRVAQVDPDPAVGRVHRQGVGVAGPPRADDRALEQQLHAVHSARKATSGSTRSARRAGTTTATHATPANSISTAAYVTGSAGETLNSSV